MKTMHYAVNYLGLISQLRIRFEKSWVRVEWDITELGEPYPGGFLMVKDAQLHFERDGQEPVVLHLIAEPPSRATITGLKGFRRVRGTDMPRNPVSYAMGLEEGEYRVRFQAELIDCERLVHYCDAFQFFPIYFDEMLEEYERTAKLWASRNHAEALEVFRFPYGESLDTIAVPAGVDEPPSYHVTNEADLPVVEWKSAPVITAKTNGGTLQPEAYFSKQLKSGIPYLRDYKFCRYGTHCTEAPTTVRNVGTGLRPFAMWGNSFSLYWLLTADAESGEAANFSARMCNGYLEQGPAPHYQHLLTMGISTMMLIRYARASGDASILELSHDIWKRWPYDWERHSPATQPNEGGTDTTPNDTYNMKAVGACAMWLLGKYVGDEDLMERGHDCITRFVLPGMLDAGYWYYRPDSPEGDIVNGIQSNNHYDGFVKQLISRLLMHPEWREEPGVMDTLRRGMDFSLRELTLFEGNEMKWELHHGAEYGPRETLARYIGHAGMLTEPLWVLAKYCDSSYLKPLQQSVQYAYNRRDEEIMADYWDNAWFYSIYVGLFILSALGTKFENSASELKLDISETTAPAL